ncbi:TonB-dependent receptor [Maribacter sp.]|uniref:TonB-dependent receptor domain-containing protein n=1 Tax=Maribacter sp. TaxID=1897614 RepID=UPI003298AFCC
MKKFLLTTLAIFAFSTVALKAQTTISGVITDTEIGEPLIGANVIIQGTNTGASTDYDGKFSITSNEPLPWNLSISYAGYASKIVPITTASTNLKYDLKQTAFIVDEVVISASRRREKVQEAPASVTVLSAKKLVGSPQIDAARNLVNVPGVTVQQQSGSRMNFEMRAAASTFSTRVFPIKDYRSLVAPGNNTFQSDKSGLSNIDLERIEVVRGAGSALYGPGVTSGVIHFITKSAIDKPGTTLQVYGGELNTYGAALRHATKVSDKFGFKINLQYNRGDEFTLDGSEGTTAADGTFTRQIDKFQSTIIQPALTSEGVVDDRVPGKTLLELTPRADGNVMQDYYWNMGSDVTLEFRPQDDLSIIVAGGLNQASSVFYNDLGEGLSQPQEVWGQARMQKGGLFAQFYTTHTNFGPEDRPIFLYQTGNRVPLAIKQYEGQLQYNFDIPDFLNANFTVGSDYRLTKTDTEGLVHGRNENDDDYNVFGIYAQGKFELAKKLDLVLAGRFDKFNIPDETAIAPRVALVYKASPKHTFRASFNNASFSPSAAEWNYDFPVNSPVPGFFDFWLAGSNDIHSFDNATSIEFLNHNVTAAGISAATGIPIESLTPLAGALPQELPKELLGTGGLTNEFVHQFAAGSLLAAMQANGLEDFIDDIQGVLANSPTGNNGTFLGINALEGGAPNNNLTNTVRGVIATSKTYEIGYKGIIGDKFSASLDLYAITERGGFDFTAIAPLIGLNGFSQDPFLAKTGELIGALVEAGLSQEVATGVVSQAYAGTAALIPNFYSTGSVETNRVPQDDGILHVAAGYRVFDAPYTRYGADLGLQYFASDKLTFFGNYSWVNASQFEREQGDGSAPFTTFLNAPANKYRLGANYGEEKGIRANVSFQHDDAFTASAGQFSGEVQEKNLVDAGISYVFNNGLAVDLSAQNLFDNEYRALVNMPSIGRRVIAKLTYSFGGNKE